MIKKNTFLFSFLLIASMMWGQSVSKQINDIKRSSQYITAEATMETEEQAYKLAEELLSKQISDFVSTDKSLRNAPNVIVKDVAGKAERLQMNRGTMTRVFLYVKMTDVMPAGNTRVLIQQQNIDTLLSVQPKVQVERTLREDRQAETVEAVPNPAITSTVIMDSPRSEDVSQHPVSVSGHQDVVIDVLLKCQHVADAKNQMNRLRVERKLKRFGAADSCPNPAQCFWLIFDGQGQVVTILGKGNAERINYRTKNQDALSNYKDMGAIWFTLTQ